ncbi:unnamed protein product [Angiostrongylus costaricensis]|uniref:MgtE domain-containing protein n=1 Tax=Angiostrongylus costaricensis TaxID=334426 RepID=A0A158PGU9_ANGCS|nr:unnamed protein product [Angiostrongylus costaricensis]
MVYFFNRTRYVVVVLSTICLTLIFSNSIAFNFTIICMDDVRIEYYQQQSINNGTSQYFFALMPDMHSINSKRCLLKSNAWRILRGLASAKSFILFIKILNILDESSPHWLESGSHTNALFSAIAVGCLIGTLLSQFTSNALFLLQGMGTALSFPATGLIASQWSTVRASGTFMAILSCHAQVIRLGHGCPGIPAINFPSSKILVALAYFRAIVTDRCIIGVWLSSFGGNVGFQTFLLYGPTYMNKVCLQFLTLLKLMAFAFAVGPISDRATFVSDRLCLIFFAVFSQGSMAMAIFSLIRKQGLAQLAYTLSIVFSGVNVVGTIKCVARQHVHIVMAVISFLLCIIILLIPVAVNIVCPDNTPEQWSRFFLGVSAIVFLSNIPFPFVARSDPAPWTSDKVSSFID